LHRHGGRTRPESLRAAQLWLLRPETNAEGVAAFGSSEFVYARYVLLRSYLALREREAVRLPNDIEPLVEEVYRDEEPAGLDSAWSLALQQSRRDLEDRQAEAVHLAQEFAIKPPSYDGDLLRDFNRELEEDAPELHPTLQALTRLVEPTVSLVCLYQTPAGLRAAPDANAVIDPGRQPDLAAVRELLKCSLTLNRRALVHHFIDQRVPSGWRECALLRHHRIAAFDTDGRLRAAGYTLLLDPHQGLVITRDNNTRGSDA
jgi:CRISPR-associated endonuclease/helicase Cas3